MHFSLALCLAQAVLMALVRAQDVDSNDIPSQCRNVCNSVVALTQYCSAQSNQGSNNGSDSDDIKCICNYTNANHQVPLCKACARSANATDTDLNDIVQSCSFTSTTYTPGATLAAGSSLSVSGATATGQTSPTSTSGTERSTSSGTVISTITSTSTRTDNDSGSASVGTSTMIGTQATTSPMETSQTTPNGVAPTKMPLVGVGAAAAVACLMA